jgi:predicted nucleotidyltransferase
LGKCEPLLLDWLVVDEPQIGYHTACRRLHPQELPMSVPKLIEREAMEQLADWCRRHSVRWCVLFGSQATGKVHAATDVDLAIWPGRPRTPADKLRWICELSDLLQQEVNLLFVSADLDPVLGFELVRDGRLIFEQAAGLWEHHRAQLWHAYNDSLPFRRAEQARLRQFAQEVLRGL